MDWYKVLASLQRIEHFIVTLLYHDIVTPFFRYKMSVSLLYFYRQIALSFCYSIYSLFIGEKLGRFSLMIDSIFVYIFHVNIHFENVIQAVTAFPLDTPYLTLDYNIILRGKLR